jgi:large subunit ribosomal protein L24
MKQPKSKQPRKQRKWLVKMPLHLRRKQIKAHLSKSLREKFKRRSIPLRVGDKVKVMRGKFKDTETQVVEVDLKNGKIFADKITVKKRNNRVVLVPLKASNLLITELNIEDKRRQLILGRKVGEKVVEEEAKRIEERKAEEERKRQEEEKKREEERKAEEERKKQEEERKKQEEKPKTKKALKKREISKESEKAIKSKLKKEWIKEKG